MTQDRLRRPYRTLRISLGSVVALMLRFCLHSLRVDPGAGGVMTASTSGSSPGKDWWLPVESHFVGNSTDAGVVPRAFFNVAFSGNATAKPSF